jgi:hypothetical protein
LPEVIAPADDQHLAARHQHGAMIPSLDAHSFAIRPGPLTFPQIMVQLL